MNSQIIELVERFDRNIESYKSGQYNETQVRREFIDPFFEALGWDVSNKAGYAEAYKDVVHEYSQKTADTTEAPDYLFRIGGTRKFFVEAKKPSVKLADETYPAYQLRRYAWTAKLPLSILTDFEELAVYDCRIKPNKNDKPSVARVNYYTYKNYIEKWEEITSVFSKDSILKGSFDKYAEINKAKRGTAEVDDAFLKEIEHWREILAKNIAIRNPKLTNRELNYAVQKTIDRIIFLRICEDRGIEEYGQLMSFQNGVNVYARLMQIFNRADEKYNSGLFHFEEEKGINEPPDSITPNLKIDDKVLKDIIKNLYYPESPYEFSVLPADILGHVYEQFLGKVIRLTPSHQAKIDEKPEVKKAGGVYYTPTYIVDYIVKNTVGKLIEDKTPNQVAKLRILDPACGSGSFLLGAYQFLLDWHFNYYVERISNSLNNKKIKDSPIYQAHNGGWKLTTVERKRILLNNIYGVDIDPQAVEVTKLSLLLKVLEGETDETLASQMRFFHERALPDLSNNIKCGNSLIGPDFYEQTQLLFVDDEERIRINVFDWSTEFKNIMQEGGFDCVIGNPPYVFGGNFGISELEKSYFNKKYESGTGKINLFTLLIEKSMKLLRPKGLVSFIIPNTFLRVTSYSNSREFIVVNSAIKEIADLGSGVFKRVTTSSIILKLEKNNLVENNIIQIKEGIEKVTNTIRQSELTAPSFIISTKSSYLDNSILGKLEQNSLLLGNICKELIFGVVITKNRSDVVFNKFRKGLKPFLEGKDISRYYITQVEKYLLYEPQLLHRPRTPEIFESKEKLLIQRITGGKRPLNVAYDNQQFYNKESINNLILNHNTEYNIKYVLALLNSTLINWYYLKKFTNESKLTVNLSKEYLSQIPIQGINFQVAINASKHDKLISLADFMINAKKNVDVVSTPDEKECLKRQIETTDKLIDKLVYELYGLTEEEIKIVEESVK